ncbi:hypothetical protein KL933_004139 [Ogataea haglerorum]|uniref:Uncharacterized protein n=1 Tax=Ogataea haglerorum TaxID=1937702 RepID=A0AAN6HZI3_9ASCO|nr:hypothetical protein KL933_004139 [Ogataea haglerorum]KAG7728361.1 hypothetical protein KL948_004228 [Ogataea haglerorum]
MFKAVSTRNLRFYSVNHPPSFFRNPAEPPKTLDELRRPATAPPETQISSSQKLKNLGIGFGIGFASLTISVTLGILLYELLEKLKENERQLALLRKNQKEMLIQMQNYKKKITLASVENSKKHMMIQGKMQMHIALLRQQLIDQGIDPVSIDEAIEKFEENSHRIWLSVHILCSGQPKIRVFTPPFKRSQALPASRGPKHTFISPALRPIFPACAASLSLRAVEGLDSRAILHRCHFLRRISCNTRTTGLSV